MRWKRIQTALLELRTRALDAPGENPPVGLILSTKKDAAVAKYALEGLPNMVVAAEYRTTLPTGNALVKELVDTRRRLEERRRRR